MGYTTRFEGMLRFAEPLTDEQYVTLEMIIDEYVPTREDEFSFGIDLELVREGVRVDGSDPDRGVYAFEPGPVSGLQHNGAEKSYSLHRQVNVVLREMRKQWPDFALEGEMKAQGEEIGDVWALRIVDGKAVRVDLNPFKGQ